MRQGPSMVITIGTFQGCCRLRLLFIKQLQGASNGSALGRLRLSSSELTRGPLSRGCPLRGVCGTILGLTEKNKLVMMVPSHTRQLERKKRCNLS